MYIHPYTSSDMCTNMRMYITWPYALYSIYTLYTYTRRRYSMYPTCLMARSKAGSYERATSSSGLTSLDSGYTCLYMAHSVHTVYMSIRTVCRYICCVYDVYEYKYITYTVYFHVYVYKQYTYSTNIYHRIYYYALYIYYTL